MSFLQEGQSGHPMGIPLPRAQSLLALLSYGLSLTLSVSVPPTSFPLQLIPFPSLRLGEPLSLGQRLSSVFPASVFSLILDTLPFLGFASPLL